MSERWLADYPPGPLREADPPEHPAWDTWQHRLKPWSPIATVVACIGIVLFVFGAPGWGLVLLWVAIPVLVIGGGVERP